MKTNSSSVRNSIVVVLFTVLSTGLVVAVITFMASIGGPSYSPSTPEGMQTLRDIADHARPVIRALERYRVDRGEYPAKLLELSPAYLASPYAQSASRHYWYTRQTTNTYVFYIKYNWDNAMVFTRGAVSNQWCISGGGTFVDLTAKLGTP